MRFRREREREGHEAILEMTGRTATWAVWALVSRSGLGFQVRESERPAYCGITRTRHLSLIAGLPLLIWACRETEDAD